MLVAVTGAGLLSPSEYEATRTTVNEIFAPAGIRVVWVDGKLGSGQAAANATVVSVRFVWHPMGSHSSTALAYASPFGQGVKTITVFWDRVRMASGSPARVPRLLPYVLAHEMGHVLQGTDRHSETGLMKAFWDQEDYGAIEKGHLAFTPTDLDLITKGTSRLPARTGR
jgi:hypothetical protein